MHELIRTNDAVLISFVASLMKQAGIGHFVADENMSIVEGSLGVLPRRVMVDAARADEARRILREVGVGSELRSDPSDG